MKQKEDPQLTLLKYKVHAESPYNDGWTQEHYRKLYNELVKKIKKKNKK